ncbi:MAG: lactate racemase domain-containing protein [bacterium]
MNKIDDLKVRKIKQKFDDTVIENIPEYIEKAFNASGIKDRINSGDRIALTVGSRGISDIETIAREVIVNLKKAGAVPFIIPAMGSHGGATPSGQKEILKSYGITEKSMEVPIEASMKTVKIGEVEGVPIYFSQKAIQADGIIALNRIKMHTDFHGKIESGMSKVMVIGLGKHRGAQSIHSRGVYGLKELIPQAAELIINKAPVIQGIGLVENGYEDIMEISFTPPEKILEKDSELLKLAADKMPSLPVDKIDVAVVQKIGKDISGSGMDTNVIGRLYINGEKEFSSPDIKRLVVMDLTESSHGNAIGIGLADITTQKLVDKIDYKDTYENTITSSFLRRSKIPVTVESEKEAVKLALDTCWLLPDQIPEMIIMKNTLELEELYVTRPIWDRINTDELKEWGEWEQVTFDNNGNLQPVL